MDEQQKDADARSLAVIVKIAPRSLFEAFEANVCRVGSSRFSLISGFLDLPRIFACFVLLVNHDLSYIFYIHPLGSILFTNLKK